MPLPYRADHVGSLLRPPELRAIRGDPHASVERLREIEDVCILRALERQKELGFEIFSDGEFRRGGFMSDFYDSVEGLDKDGSVAREWQGQWGGQSWPQPAFQPASSGGPPLKGVVVEKIRQTRRLTAHEAAFLQRHSPGDFKITLPSANQFPAIMYKKGLSDRAYANSSEFLWDVVPVIQGEIQALAREGVKYIQIDAPRYSYYVDPKWRRYIQLEMGLDPERALEEAIRADNACLEGANRAGAWTGIHLCRGNNRSQWYAEGGYDPIAEQLFAELNVNAFLLEYESERAGSFEPLRFVPKNKAVVLGLISSKLPDLESEDELARRIDEAARFVPLENLALSPQCGFASTAEGNLLTEDQQWRKMELVVRVARKIWS